MVDRIVLKPHVSLCELFYFCVIELTLFSLKFWLFVFLNISFIIFLPLNTLKGFFFLKKELSFSLNFE